MVERGVNQEESLEIPLTELKNRRDRGGHTPEKLKKKGEKHPIGAVNEANWGIEGKGGAHQPYHRMRKSG